MVKAGIYLMARLNPALGGTDLWFWFLGTAGLATMLTGAYLGLKQNDIKALLAYSTITQLGVLMMLIGQDTSIAYKALVIGIVAHALYKSALFMVAGIIDHETGTRDLRRLGGLWRPMKLPLSWLQLRRYLLPVCRHCSDSWPKKPCWLLPPTPRFPKRSTSYSPPPPSSPAHVASADGPAHLGNIPG